MKFNVTWQEEKTEQVDFPDIRFAEAYAIGKMQRLGGLPTAKLLSIYAVLPETPQGLKEAK
jgi:hypothetical protein